MALIVEDGTGLSNADSYVSIDDIADYAQKFGKSWDDTGSGDVHARRATQFIDNKYSFASGSLKATQSLLFPLASLYVRGHKVEGIPRSLKDACCELAIIAQTTDLMESVAARAYTYRSVKVGDIEKTERYDSNDDQPIFHTVELILRPLLAGDLGGGMKVHKLRRA